MAPTSPGLLLVYIRIANLVFLTGVTRINKQLFNLRGYLDSSDTLHQLDSKLDFCKIPAFLRVLLTTDGTVTKSLESYFWEPIAIDKLNQQQIKLQNTELLLGRKIGDVILQRKIQLRGKHSGTIYAKATSLVSLDMLPAEILSSVIDGSTGIGELLRETGLETYREIIDFGVCQFENGPQENSTAIWRTYLIKKNQQPFIQVTETFPLKVFTN